MEHVSTPTWSGREVSSKDLNQSEAVGISDRERGEQRICGYPCSCNTYAFVKAFSIPAVMNSSKIFDTMSGTALQASQKVRTPEMN